MLETTKIVDKDTFSRSKHCSHELEALGEKYITVKQIAEHDSISANVRTLIKSIENCDKSKKWQKIFISNLHSAVDHNWVFLY
jgi:hypothetical protein